MYCLSPFVHQDVADEIFSVSLENLSRSWSSEYVTFDKKKLGKDKSSKMSKMVCFTLLTVKVIKS